jgi:hypothetical protein
MTASSTRPENRGRQQPMIHPPWNVSKTIPHTKMSSGPFRRELPDAAAVEGDRINGLLPESDEGRVADNPRVGPSVTAGTFIGSMKAALPLGNERSGLAYGRIIRRSDCCGKLLRPTRHHPAERFDLGQGWARGICAVQCPARAVRARRVLWCLLAGPITLVWVRS